MGQRVALVKNTKLKFKNREGGLLCYEIESEIGRGGSCIVYEASYITNSNEKKYVRIKEFYPCKLRIKRLDSLDLEVNEDDLEQFNVLKSKVVHDFSIENQLYYSPGLSDLMTNTVDLYFDHGTIYIVSTYSSKMTLANYKPKDLKTALSLVCQVAYIVEKIHQRGYLYLDIKPDNILVVQGYHTRVQLFDFDSLYAYKKQEKEVPFRLSYTKGFAAIELQTAKIKKIGEHTDVYGIGALLYYLLFLRVPTIMDFAFSQQIDYSKMVYPINGYPDELFYYLDDFFKQTLANFYRDRYSTMHDTLIALENILALLDQSTPLLYPSKINYPKGFVGRLDYLETLHHWFNSYERCMFIHGMGGIGKSSLALAFACDLLQAGHIVVYLTYQDSLDQSLASDTNLRVQTCKKNHQESLKQYVKRKLDLIRQLCEKQKVLLIIDEFNEQEFDRLYEISQVGWKILTISRKEPQTSHYSKMLVTSLDVDSQIILFERFLGYELSFEQREMVLQITQAISNHTLMIELIAKQIANSHLTLESALELLEQNGFSKIGSEKITYEKDQQVTYIQIKQVLDLLFDTQNLSLEKKKIMLFTSLFGHLPIPISFYKSYLKINQFDALNELVLDGWIQEVSQEFYMHPVIIEKTKTWDLSLLEMNDILDCFDVKAYYDHAWMVYQRSNKTHANFMYQLFMNTPRTKEAWLEKQIVTYLDEDLFSRTKRIDLCYLLVEYYDENKAYHLANQYVLYAKSLTRRRDYMSLCKYYNLLSYHQEVLLDGAYEPISLEEKKKYRQLIASIRKVIYYAKKVNLKEMKILLVKNELGLATMFIRQNKHSRKVDGLIRQAQKEIIAWLDDCLDLHMQLELVKAWQQLYFENNIDAMRFHIKNAQMIVVRRKIEPLDEIDEFYIPCANLFCNAYDYKMSIEVLEYAIKICKKYPNVKPYVRKIEELEGYLNEIRGL